MIFHFLIFVFYFVFGETYLRRFRVMYLEMQTLSPSSLVKLGSNVQALFDQDEWYNGKVTKIRAYGHDFTGKYVKCDIVYEDEELDENVQLYDKYFETANEESWRFKDEFSKIISMYNEVVREISNIKSDVDDIMDNVADILDDEESLESSNDDKDSAYDSEGETSYASDTNGFRWYMIGNIIGVVLGFGASYTLKCYNFDDIGKWI